MLTLCLSCATLYYYLSSNQCECVMTEQQKLPTELTKKIQTLVSDIAIQVEDKLSSLLVEYTASPPMTNEQIEQHPFYQQSQQNAQSKQIKLAELQDEITVLKLKSKQALTNNLALNITKLTGSDSVLKEKLRYSQQQQTQLNETLMLTKTQLAEATVIQKAQQRENDVLIRADKAKTAIVEAQNNQITELQLQVMKVTAESERIQAEQNQAVEIALHDENQTNDLAKALTKLTEELKVKVGQTVLLQQALENANKENSGLTKQLQSNEKVGVETNSELQQQKEQLVLSNQKFEEKIKVLNEEHRIQVMGAQQKLALLSQENNAILASLDNDHQLEVDKLVSAISQKNHKNQQDQLALKNMQATMTDTQADWQKTSAAEQKKYDVLVERLTTTEWQQQQDKATQKAIKEQVQSLQKKALTKQNIADKNKEKQEAEYSKARETIKHLRDDNVELKTKLAQQVSELENKLTEYRLRFEYAQKHLAKNNQPIINQ
jgi:hypothetical protein